MEIRFYRTREEYGFLANFSQHCVAYAGDLYNTLECLYQALKFHPSLRKQFITLTPRAAADLGRSMTGMHPAWDTIKVDMMRLVIRQKAYQHPWMIRKLLDSADAELIEDSPKDYFWGCGKDGTGQNWLGRVWMELRKEIKDKQYGNKD